MSWLPYIYRKKITIAGATGAGTNYQIPLNIGESSGATGAHFHLEGKALNFPNDLRFTRNNGVTLSDYWIEKITGTAPNRLASVWVEVPDDLGSSVDICTYFGKANDTSASNGNNTFLFFDDFSGTALDTTKWTVVYGTFSVANGELYASGNPEARLRSTSYQVGNAKIRARLRLNTFLDYDLLFRYGDANNFYQTYNTTSNVHRLYKNVAGTFTQIGNNITFNPGTTYHTETAYFAGSTLIARTDDNIAYDVNATDSTFTSGYVGIKFYYVNGGDGYVDWFFVAKFVYPEPAFSSAGPLELNPLGATLLMFLS